MSIFSRAKTWRRSLWKQFLFELEYRLYYNFILGKHCYPDGKGGYTKWYYAPLFTRYYLRFKYGCDRKATQARIDWMEKYLNKLNRKK